MDIIVLTGPSSCGKTETLNLVYNLIHPPARVLVPKSPLGADPRDFEAIVDWKGKKVAFFTMGDYANAVSKAVYHYAGLSCDVLVCACNDRFTRPFSVIARYPNTRVVKSRQPVVMQAADDTAKATHIVSLI